MDGTENMDDCEDNLVVATPKSALDAQGAAAREVDVVDETCLVSTGENPYDVASRDDRRITAIIFKACIILGCYCCSTIPIACPCLVPSRLPCSSVSSSCGVL
jgi:hypothetical protein